MRIRVPAVVFGGVLLGGLVLLPGCGPKAETPPPDAATEEEVEQAEMEDDAAADRAQRRREAKKLKAKKTVEE